MERASQANEENRDIDNQLKTLQKAQLAVAPENKSNLEVKAE